jgi:hypothetical protein
MVLLIVIPGRTQIDGYVRQGKEGQGLTRFS